MGSILEDSRRARGVSRFFGGKRKYIIIIILLLLGGGAYAYFGNDEKTKKVEVKKKEWTVKKDDIKIAVESDGKVVAEDGVELSFSVSGDALEVEETFVKEGDKIVKGDKIASVKTETLERSVKSAYSSYQSVLAEYNQTMAGATGEQKTSANSTIELAKLSLEQAKISLEKIKISSNGTIAAAEKTVGDTKKELDANIDEWNSEDVEDTYDTLVSTIKSILISFEGILADSDEILGVDNTLINNAYENSLGIRDMFSLTKAKDTYRLAKEKKAELDIISLTFSTGVTNSDIDSAADKTKVALSVFEEHLYYMRAMLDASGVSIGLTQTILESFKTTISAHSTSINTKITTLDTGIRAVDTAKDGLVDYVVDYKEAQDDLEEERAGIAQNIATAEATIRSRELSLEQVQNTLKELLAPLTQYELASARSRLTTASVSLEAAQFELEKATLLSPIDGEVAMLGYKTGDIILDNDEPVAIIINNDTLFIEVNVEEADINKIKVGQRAYATFDALDNLQLEGEVSYISLTSETDNSGIVTYMVRIIFSNTKDAQIREGMTAFVDFIVTEVKDVLIIPVSAVRNVEGKPSVEMLTGERAEVITGFTDGDNVEVISGLNQGDKIYY